MENFDEKIGLGAQLSHLKAKKEYLAKVKEQVPCEMVFKTEYLRELEPLVYCDEEAWGEINALCSKIIDVYIGAIDRQFEKAKAEFEKL